MQDYQQTTEEALRAENARLRTELEQLGCEGAELTRVNMVLQNCLERLRTTAICCSGICSMIYSVTSEDGSTVAHAIAFSRSVRRRTRAR